MLVEVESEIQARRLQNQGYERTGEKAVEAPVEDVDKLLEMDDVDVEKLSLHRNNGSVEAHVIDDLIDQGHERGTFHQYTGVTVRRSYATRESDKAFHLEADKLTIYRDFKNIIEGDVQQVVIDEEEYEKARSKMVDKLEDELEALERKYQEHKDKLEEVEDRDFEDWVDEDLPKIEMP